MAAYSQPYAQPIASANGNDLTRFEQLVKQRELNPKVAEQLKEILSICEIVLLCDDSDSMSNPIAEEGTDPFAPKRSTRWLELKKLASVIIEFVTAINPSGLDIYFLNREKVCGVTTLAGLQSVFSAVPNGSTPLIGSLKRIYAEKINYVSSKRKLLIITITDGEPTDGSRADLFNTLVNITKSGNVHVSFCECTDNADDMEYLDAWDGCIKNFDNSDDYREELGRVKAIQGAQFKFDYTDYVIKILLATFVRWYFNLDQVKVSSGVNSIVNYNQGKQFSPNYQPQYPDQDPPPYSASNALNTSSALRVANTQQYNSQQYNAQPYSAKQYKNSNSDACCVVL